MFIKKHKTQLLVIPLTFALFLSACNPSIPAIVPVDPVPPPLVIEGDYTWVVEPKFTAASMKSENGLFAVSSPESSGLWGYVDTAGREVLPFSFEKALPFVGNFGAVMENGSWGIVDRAGNYLSNPFGLTPFETGEGLTAFCEDGLWGYMTEDGTLAIPPEYDAAAPFRYGAATVKKNGLEGTIDSNGEYIIEPNWFTAQKINDRFFVIGENTPEGVLYGIADENGNVRFAPRYTELSRTGRSYFAYVSKAEKSAAEKDSRPPKKGLVTAAGISIEKCEYDNFIAYENGHCIFQKDGKYGVFNNLGEMIYKAEYENAYFCTDNEGHSFLRMTKDKNLENDLYLNNMGKKTEGPTAISGVSGAAILGGFQNGYAVFESSEKKYGVIKLDGTVLFPALYSSVTLTQGGSYFQLEENGKWGLGDNEGNVLLSPAQGYDAFVSIPDDSDFAYIGTVNHVERDGVPCDVYGYIKKSGKNISVAISPRFEALGVPYKVDDGKYYAMAKEHGLYGIIELILKN